MGQRYVLVVLILHLDYFEAPYLLRAFANTRFFLLFIRDRHRFRCPVALALNVPPDLVLNF